MGKSVLEGLWSHSLEKELLWFKYLLKTHYLKSILGKIHAFCKGHNQASAIAYTERESRSWIRYIASLWSGDLTRCCLIRLWFQACDLLLMIVMSRETEASLPSWIIATQVHSHRWQYVQESVGFDSSIKQGHLGAWRTTQSLLRRAHLGREVKEKMSAIQVLRATSENHSEEEDWAGKYSKEAGKGCLIVFPYVTRRHFPE